MSITTDLDAIRARVDATTAGPWQSVPMILEYEVRADIDDLSWALICRTDDSDEHDQQNAEFIAAARTDVPFLLDLVDELRRQVKVWKKKAES